MDGCNKRVFHIVNNRWLNVHSMHQATRSQSKSIIHYERPKSNNCIKPPREFISLTMPYADFTPVRCVPLKLFFPAKNKVFS